VRGQGCGFQGMPSLLTSPWRTAAPRRSGDGGGGGEIRARRRPCSPSRRRWPSPLAGGCGRRGALADAAVRAAAMAGIDTVEEDEEGCQAPTPAPRRSGDGGGGGEIRAQRRRVSLAPHSGNLKRHLQSQLHPKLQVSQLNFEYNSIWFVRMRSFHLSFILCLIRFGFFDCVRFRSAELARDRPWHRRRPSQVSSLA